MKTTISKTTMRFYPQHFSSYAFFRRDEPIIESDEHIDYWAGVYHQLPHDGVRFEDFIRAPHAYMKTIGADAAGLIQ